MIGWQERLPYAESLSVRKRLSQILLSYASSITGNNGTGFEHGSQDCTVAADGAAEKLEDCLT
jgi:hypothetical protein